MQNNLLKILFDIFILIAQAFVVSVIISVVIDACRKYVKEKKESLKPSESSKSLESSKSSEFSVDVLKLVIILFVLFPLILNAIVLNKWYLVFPIWSKMNGKEWIAFFGSYIGVLGTVVCGWVAYRQNELMEQQQQQSVQQQDILKQQNKQIVDLQNLLTMYQAVPRPFFNKLRMEFYDETEKDFKRQKEKEDAYYETFWERMPEDTGACISLSIDLRLTDVIPIRRYNVLEIKYEIAGNTYSVDIPQSSGNDSFVPGYGGEGLQYNDSIHMLIMDTDTVNGRNGTDGFFSAMKIFNHWNSFPQYGYDKSKLTFRIFFENQAARSSTYIVRYQIENNGKEIKISTPACKQIKAE